MQQHMIADNGGRTGKERTIIIVILSKSQKTALRKRAALLTASSDSDERITMSDLVRDQIDQLIASPLPPTARAREYTHASSGKPVRKIANETPAETLQSEGVSV